MAGGGFSGSDRISFRNPADHIQVTVAQAMIELIKKSYFHINSNSVSKL